MLSKISEKIYILSDLHLEFGSTSLPFENIDLIILANDTNPSVKGIKWCTKWYLNLLLQFYL